MSSGRVWTFGAAIDSGTKGSSAPDYFTLGADEGGSIVCYINFGAAFFPAFEAFWDS